MSLKGYGVLKGRPVKTMPEPKGGHLEILIEAKGEKYRIALNVRSMAVPPELRYSILKDFSHPIINKLGTLEEGFTLTDDNKYIGLDYIRGNLFDYRKMNKAPHIDEQDNELADFLQLYIDKAAAQKDAVLYAFGQTWGKEDKPDMYFGFSPGQGIHDIHMNQGNKGRWDNDNGTFQDGGLFIYFPKDNKWVAFFFAFQSQSFHTNDDDGSALEVVDLSIEQSVVIVSALLNPSSGNPTVGLLNRMDKPISLDGWRLTDAKNSVILDGEIASGAYRLFSCDKNKLKFSDNGGVLSLVNQHGQKIDGVCYSTPDYIIKDITTVF